MIVPEDLPLRVSPFSDPHGPPWGLKIAAIAMQDLASVYDVELEESGALRCMVMKNPSMVGIFLE